MARHHKDFRPASKKKKHKQEQNKKKGKNNHLLADGCRNHLLGFWDTVAAISGAALPLPVEGGAAGGGRAC